MPTATKERSVEEMAGSGEPTPTEADEKLRMEREEREAKKAEEQLSFGIGGTPATKFRLQLTGGEVELPTSAAKRFEKDTDVEIRVGNEVLSGWVKTVKHTTDKRGGSAARVAVVVLDTGE